MLPTNDSRADEALFFSWGAEGYRLGGSTMPVRLQQNLLMTNADWRASYGWAVENLPDFFEPHVAMAAVDGPGTYAHLGHPVIDNATGAQVAWDTGYNFTDGLPGNPSPLEDYMQLGNTFNWDATFPYQSHGNFIPYNLTSGEPFGEKGWTTCFGAYNCTKGEVRAEVDDSGHSQLSHSSSAGESPSVERLRMTGADPIWDCPGGRSEPGGWTKNSVGGAAPCWRTSYAQINQVYKMMREDYGISNCMCEFLQPIQLPWTASVHCLF